MFDNLTIMISWEFEAGNKTCRVSRQVGTTGLGVASLGTITNHRINSALFHPESEDLRYQG